MRLTRGVVLTLAALATLAASGCATYVYETDLPSDPLSYELMQRCFDGVPADVASIEESTSFPAREATIEETRAMKVVVDKVKRGVKPTDEEYAAAGCR
ncbi:MAG: hypothetical protein OXU77_19195 [Gammaproteobacteria bacterium]|nr:hypothetical protein [Gammaproteobacteria bacterium]MDE0441012.1 hypothetical protein [Gammaproteobacteria bacterium]